MSIKLSQKHGAIGLSSTRLDHPFAQTLGLLNNLCLLEALVGTCWQSAFSSAAGVELAAHHYWLLFLGLWLIYAGDRWLDVRSVGSQALTERHAFARKHHQLLARAWLTVLVAAVGCAVATLTKAEWVSGLALLGASAVYMFLVHFARSGNRAFVKLVVTKCFRKELWVSVIYAGGIGLFVWPQIALRWDLAACQLTFSGLVLLNLLAIQQLESGVDTLHSDKAIDVPPRSAMDGGSATTLLALGCLLAAHMSPDSATATFLVYVGLAALLLSFVGRWTPHMRWTNNHAVGHALADVALLTPLLGQLV